MLRRSPVFTITAVLSLALGVGANTAIFSILQAVSDPQTLVVIARNETVSSPCSLLLEIRDRTRSLQGVLAFSHGLRLNRVFRHFNETDVASRRDVMVINETFARHDFEVENPIGKQLGNSAGGRRLDCGPAGVASESDNGTAQLAEVRQDHSRSETPDDHFFRYGFRKLLAYSHEGL